MTEVKASPDVDAYLAMLPPQMQELMGAVRRLILEAVPELEEAIKWGAPVYSRHGLVCYIKAAKKHMSFGFYKGTSLSDPQRLLEGTGMDLRHIKIRSREDIRPEAFQAMVREAVSLQEAKK